MLGQPPPLRGRPPKTASRAFRLLALAAFARRLSQDAITARINDGLNESVTQPTVRKWLRGQLARYARPTVSIKRPDDLEIRVACLLFRRSPARARPLMRMLSMEPHVSRVEFWRGETNVFAEVMALDDRPIDEIIERYEPDFVYPLVERCERTRAVLRRLGEQAVAEES
jgi:hypothetical protein